MNLETLITNFKTISENVVSTIMTIGYTDILDIALLAYVIYLIMKFLKQNRAGQLVKGVFLYFLIYLVCSTLGLRTTTYIIQKTFSIGILAIVIMFQPELRRLLEKIGHTKLTSFVPGMSSSEKEMESIWAKAIDAICDSCRELSASCTGALIVVEQKTKLGEQIENGTILNADPSKELFGNIFYPKTPLHDGAAIIRDGKIIAAACFLPKPAKEETINKKLGSRHRAAIGMSENSDAIVIVVSEETGQISVAQDGVLVRDYTPEALHSLLWKKLIEDPAEERIRIKHAVKKSKRDNRSGIFKQKRKSDESKKYIKTEDGKKE